MELDLFNSPGHANQQILSMGKSEKFQGFMMNNAVHMSFKGKKNTISGAQVKAATVAEHSTATTTVVTVDLRDDVVKEAEKLGKIAVQKTVSGDIITVGMPDKGDAATTLSNTEVAELRDEVIREEAVDAVVDELNEVVKPKRKRSRAKKTEE